MRELCCASQQNLATDVAEWDGPAVLLPLTTFVGGFEARGAHRVVPFSWNSPDRPGRVRRVVGGSGPHAIKRAMALLEWLMVAAAAFGELVALMYVAQRSLMYFPERLHTLV